MKFTDPLENRIIELPEQWDSVMPKDIAIAIFGVGHPANKSDGNQIMKWVAMASSPKKTLT